MATAELRGFLMHYDVRGDGEPLLLLHGGMGIGDDWRHIFVSDPPGYTVIVPDLRGHGRSTSPAEEEFLRKPTRSIPRFTNSPSKNRWPSQRILEPISRRSTETV